MVFATILGTLVVFSISALVAVWLHRRRLIRNVNKFYQDKAASERDLESSEAALAIRGIELPDVSFRQPEPESEEEENDDSDIISKFHALSNYKSVKVCLFKQLPHLLSSFLT